MTPARAAHMPLFWVTMGGANREVGDCVVNAGECFSRLIRPREFVLRTPNLMSQSRSTGNQPTMPLFSAGTRRGNKGVGNGVRSAKECFLPVIRVRMFVL